MNRKTTRIALFALLGLGVAAGSASRAEAASSPATAAAAAPAKRTPEGATILKGIGRMRVDGSHEWVPTKLGVPVPADSVVEASSGSPLEMRFSDGVELTLEPNAIAKIKSANRLPSENNGWARGFHVELRNGEADVRVPTEPRGGRAFLVSSTAGTLTDWRGSMHVTVVEDTTAAAIYEGALVVGSNGQGFAVFNTTGVFLRKGVNPERARIIPAAPAFAQQQQAGVASSFAIVKNGESTPLGFSWAPVDGAAMYRVEVATDPGMSNVITLATTKEPSYVIKEAAPGGRYYARVRAISAVGIVGGWTKPRALRVVRATYPEGAVVAADGTIIVPENAGVTLSDTEGLEVAMQSFDGRELPPPVGLYWIPAPSSLRLGEHGSRLFRVRDAALGAETRIVLGRRELKANVIMGPSRARWPEQPVTVQVSLSDPSGRMDVSNEPVALEVSVNLSPVNVEWHHNGTSWWATVPPRFTRGPWAVRVVAKDKMGTEIGRGHLEVEGANAEATVYREVPAR